MQLGQMVGKHTWNGVGNIVICDNIQLLKHDPFPGGGGGEGMFPLISQGVVCVCVCGGGGFIRRVGPGIPPRNLEI